jgi:CDP-paratose 2-epimerase
MNILVTGSSGLIGSEAVAYFDALGHQVFGIDNNMRASFFGPEGDTTWNLKNLLDTTKRFEHFDIDIRSRPAILDFFKTKRIEAIIHCAAQPSHDWAKKKPFDDFDVNAVGTLNLLEATRLYATEASFIFMSTNKVYGDAPNELPLVELETRWDYAEPDHYQGVDETCRIDQSKHSLFGASKVAADVMTQEYGRYFDMPTVCFRGGCLTGPNHSGVQLHGFLSYLVKAAVSGEPYTIIGYKGKQVRDQIHSYDVARAFEAYIEAPRPGEVYNLGGGRQNSASILECFAKITALTGRDIQSSYREQPREGDHICYISNLTKFKRHYPGWDVTKSLDDIIQEMVKLEMNHQNFEHDFKK